MPTLRRRALLSIAKSQILLGAALLTVVNSAGADATPAPISSRMVVIDPGHGGQDIGAVGKGGLLEKTVALDVALKLRQLLAARPATLVQMTRQTDTFVALSERTKLANSIQADLFISLHANASLRGRVSGFEIYYLDTSGDLATKKLAERENSSVKYEGTQADLHYILSDLIQNAKLSDSIVLANLLHRSIIKNMTRSWDKLRNLGVKRAPFYVLVGAHMPCVLIEMSFIDNPIDESNLAKEEYRRDMASAIYLGVDEFLNRSSTHLFSVSR